MCVYKCTEKPFDGWVETLVKHEVHRYLSTSEWINAAHHEVVGKWIPSEVSLNDASQWLVLLTFS